MGARAGKKERSDISGERRGCSEPSPIPKRAGCAQNALQQRVKISAVWNEISGSGCNPEHARRRMKT